MNYFILVDSEKVNRVSNLDNDALDGPASEEVTPSVPPAVESAPVPSAAAEITPSLPKLYNYLQGKGMSQSYMSSNDPYMSQTLIAEFLKTNPVSVPSTNRVMDNIDLTRDVAERRRRATRNNLTREPTEDQGNIRPSRESLAPNPPLPLPGHSKSHSQLPPNVTGAMPAGMLIVCIFICYFQPAATF